MNILVLGSNGFIAKNLIAHLRTISKYNILIINKKSSESEILSSVLKAKIIFHFAGINKESHPNYTFKNNYIFTRKICSILQDNNKNKFHHSHLPNFLLDGCSCVMHIQLILQSLNLIFQIFYNLVFLSDIDFYFFHRLD